jgi:hypothetical protein
VRELTPASVIVNCVDGRDYSENYLVTKPKSREDTQNPEDLPAG